jgi:hypothetical protein
MNRSVKRLLFWTPRILCMLFAAFTSMFALDVFGEGYSFWNTILALLMHLVPVFFLILILVLSWRWAWVGGIVFPSLGVLYIVMAWHRFPWSVYAIIAGPLFLLGILFWINWIYRAELKANA